MISSCKFKVHDLVTIPNRPFGLYEVIKQLPSKGDKTRYRVRSARERNDCLVYESEIEKLDEVLNELLDLAAVRKTDDVTRNDLLLRLCDARNAFYQEGRKVPKDIENLKKSIEKTMVLLKKMSKHNAAFGYQVHEIGAGIVDVSQMPLLIPKTLKVTPLVPLHRGFDRLNLHSK